MAGSATSVNELDCTLDRGRRLAWAVDPRKRRLFPEPDQLPPGVVTVLADDELARRRLVADTGEHLDDLAVDQPGERLRGRRDAAGKEALHLRDDPAGELHVDAARHAQSRVGHAELQAEGDDLVVRD